jgi:hypothetical protein
MFQLEEPAVAPAAMIFFTYDIVRAFQLWGDSKPKHRSLAGNALDICKH